MPLSISSSILKHQVTTEDMKTIMAPEVTKRFIEGVKKANWPEEQKILIGVALLEGSSLRVREIVCPK